MITILFVGSGDYVDAGATALKIPLNPALPSVNLTGRIVTTGASAITTTVPSPPDHPYEITYNVKDIEVPPNRALTARRLVLVRQFPWINEPSQVPQCSSVVVLN